MAKKKTLVLMTFGMSVGALAVAGGLFDEGELVTCGEPIWDIGHTSEKSLAHEFRVSNDSQKAVRVSRVDVSCGCLVVRDVEKLIPAGESISIPIQFNVPSVPGRFRKQILVRIESPEQSGIVLTIRGVVDAKGKAFVTPGRMDFGTAAWSGPVERRLIVGRHDNGDVGPIEVEGLVPGLTFIRAEPMELGRKRLVLSLDARIARDGIQGGSVTVTSPSDQFESLSLPIVWHPQ